MLRAEQKSDKFLKRSVRLILLWNTTVFLLWFTTGINLQGQNCPELRPQNDNEDSQTDA